MKEHEQLKAICDEIGYEVKEHYAEEYGYSRLYGHSPTMSDPLPCNDVIEIDVREIIFTHEFMERLRKYIEKQNTKFFDAIKCDVMNNLDNPAEYLYNLLNLG